MAFAPNGRLYGTVKRAGSSSDLLVKIKKRNGAAKVIGPIGFSNVYGLVFGEDGLLYGAADGDLFMIPALIQIDTQTGRGRLIGRIPDTNGMFGLTRICFQ